MKFVLLGNSAAALGAAEAIRQVDSDAPLTLVSDEPESVYSRALISYELAGWLPKGSGLELRSPDYYQQKKIQTRMGQRAVKIEPSAHEVVLQNGDRLPYDRLLLAVGGSPQKTGVKGEKKTGVFSFRTYRDLLNIHEAIKSAKHAVVLGGGCIGLQAASGLHHHGVKTTIAIASPHLLSQIADAECGDFFQELFEKNGIAIKTGVQPVEFKGADRVQSVLFDDGSELPAQIVITGKGVAPNIQLAQGTNLKVDWGFVTDDHMRTTEPDIYAAGDCAVTYDRVACRSTVNAIWPGAYEQGRVAGFNMVGIERRYDGSMRMNAAEFFGVPFISLGVVKPQGEGYETHSRMSKGSAEACFGQQAAATKVVASATSCRTTIYWKLVFKGNLLVGAVLMGKVDGAGILSNLMQKRVDISSIKSELLAGHYNYARVLPLVKTHGEVFREREYKETLIA